MAHDLVSVIIPCYKQAEFVAEAIASVLSQSYPHHEIVVVDDGSPDHTPEVLRGYPMVRYLRQANQGVCAARNRGIHESKGEFLVFLDADDRLLPHHLTTSLEAFQNQPEAAFVCGDYRWFGGESTPHGHKCDPQPDYYGTLLRGNFIGGLMTVAFRREVLLKVGGFDTRFVMGEDHELYLRIARRYPIACHHQVVAEYRRHGAQTSLDFASMLKWSVTVLRRQRRYVAGNAHYRAAYQDGLRRRRDLYVGGICVRVRRAVQAGHFKRAAAHVNALLRYAPMDAFSLLAQRLARGMFRWGRGRSPARTS